MTDRKRCRCGATLPIELFTADRTRADGRDPRCPECRNRRRRELTAGAGSTLLPYWQDEDRKADLEGQIALWIAGASRLYPTGDEPVCWWLTHEQHRRLFNADDEIGDLGGDAG